MQTKNRVASHVLARALLKWGLVMSVGFSAVTSVSSAPEAPTGPLDIKVYVPLIQALNTNNLGPGPIMTPVPVATPSIPCPTIVGWRAEYWNNAQLSGAPALCRDDEEVSFDWGLNAPAQSINADQFSARWTREWTFPAGQYRFHVEADDSVRLWIDGKPVIDSWFDTGDSRNWEADTTLSQGKHEVKLEYYEGTGAARVNLWWELLTEVNCPTGTGWQAQYFNNRDLAGNPILCSNEETLNFDWGKDSPSPNISTDGFSARYIRTVKFTAGRYRFRVGSDDGVRFWLDDRQLVNIWNARNRADSTVDVNVAAGDHVLKLEYFEDVADASVSLKWDALSVGDGPSTEVDPVCGKITDWKGEYYNNRTLTGEPKFCRNDGAVQYNWGTGSPGTGIGVDNFSVRWTRIMSFTNGNYKFKLSVDDGVRLYVDDKLVLDHWNTSGKQDYETTLALTSGWHTILVEYYEDSGGAIIRLSWDLLDEVSCPASATGWKGEYFANRTLSGSPIVCKDEADINLGWGTRSPSPLLNADSFSARWTKQQYFIAGEYKFRARADEGVRIYLDNQTILDKWVTSGTIEHVIPVVVTAGTHTIRVEYWDDMGDAGIIVRVQSPGSADTPLPALPATATGPSTGGITVTPVPGVSGTPTPSTPSSSGMPQVGKVYRITNYLSGKVVEIANKSTGGSHMSQGTWANMPWQKWEFIPVALGGEPNLYQIRSLYSNSCMGVYKNPTPSKDISTKDRTEIVQNSCGTMPDVWEITPGTTGLNFKLRHSLKYMSVYNNSLDDGATIVQFKFYDGGNQAFNLMEVGTNGDVATPAPTTAPLATPVQGKVYKITNVRSGKVIQPAELSIDPNVKLTQGTWSNSSQQKWEIAPASGFDPDYYIIRNIGSGKCFETYTLKGVAKSGYPYVQNDCKYGTAQLFKLQAVQQQGFMIVDKLSPYALTVENSSLDDGALLLQAGLSGSLSSTFTFTEVTR